MPVIVWVAAFALAVVLLAFYWFSHRREQAAAEARARMEEARERMEFERQQTHPQPKKAAPVMAKRVRTRVRTAGEPEPETFVAEVAEPFKDDEEPSVETAKTETPAAKRTVRFTDGTRVVKRPDGSVEVPREFSYAGAGLKKPFWVYDAELERSGKMEREAERERKAREEWRKLRDEARRTAE